MSPLRKRIGLVTVAALVVVGGTIAARSTSSDSTAPTSTTLAPDQIGVNPFRTGRTLVIPHGGGDGLFPEDTMIAYTSTMAMGADVVDVDLQLTSDGTLIAFHDSTVDRITGSTGNVHDMTDAQISALDAGWSFAPAGHPDQHPFRGQGIRIPTLESIVQKFPHALLSLDLKDESMAMIEPLCTLLVAHHRLDDVFVGSNSDALILAFRTQCPTVRTSATMVDVYADRDARASNDASFVPAVTVDQPPFRVNGEAIVDAASIAWAHQHGIAVLPWVVNDADDMRLLVGEGIDGIYTSYPDRLLRLLGRCTSACPTG